MQWVARLTLDRWIPASREFEPHQRPPVVSLSKKLYSHLLVLVGSRNGFERDLHKHKNCLFHKRTKINKYKLNLNTWSERLRLILRLFLKFESFGYNNKNGDFVIHHYIFKETLRNLVLLLNLSS